MDAYSVLTTIGTFLLKITERWILIFLHTFDKDVIWITLPVYITWFFTHYFQEKKETSFGNAATNGTIAIWVALDWIRQMVTRLGINPIKLGLAVFLIIYGIWITIEAIRAKPVAKYLGRINELAYFQLTLTPIMYNKIPLDFLSIMAIIFYFPIFYLLTSWLFKVLPEPYYMKQEEEKEFYSFGPSDWNVYGGQDQTFIPA